MIPLSSHFAVPTYYLILSMTVSICLWWLVQRSHSLGLSRRLTLDLSLIVMVSGFIGGRLFHVFYEDFPYYREEPTRVLQIWNGGFVFYGGALLAGFAAIIYLFLKNKSQLENYLDMFAPVLSFSYVMGRIACLLAGCCFGKYCELPWAYGGRHPTQAYAAAWELGVLFILLGLEKAPRKRVGAVFYIWMILHAIGRLIMEFFRDDFRGPSLGMSISSWISFLIIALGFYFLLRKPTHRSTTSS
ncbi:prolipoprotein diacylglyceryl transferase [Bdellovibrio sp. ArHS]|uniref:prolipoprotein diacylglyceryl transferase n=1 Tax=Bdellovibrio sp. ArHS TaxID=1569284 RepID=UPI0025C30FB8|nr:prolipoprotein diacylglyceryl transferase [Bdellovibrio sp. ArHS]